MNNSHKPTQAANTKEKPVIDLKRILRMILEEDAQQEPKTFAEGVVPLELLVKIMKNDGNI